MRIRKTALYQGRDWSSYRWTVAEAFDTLERIHDLSLCQGWVDEPDQTELTSSIIPELLGLCEDLRGHLSFVCADTSPLETGAAFFASRWTGFEMKMLLDELFNKVLDLSDQGIVRNFGSVILLASALKDHLKRLDQ